MNTHKNRLRFALALALLALTGRVVATPACCLPAKPSEQATGPLSPRSLYHLDATWTNDAGAPVQLAAFRGQPVIVAMTFTHCEYACPAIVADISRTLAQLPPAAAAKTRVVLVSFDSARDTPPTLAAYRARAGLGDTWTLLHGSPANVRELAMLLGVKYQQDSRGQFSHSNLFTVLNAAGDHQRGGLGSASRQGRQGRS
jgi:protein SCO1/2